MKKALITGITGQDGSYLAEFLLDKGYEVHGTVRAASSLNRKRIEHIRNHESLFLHYSDLGNITSFRRILLDIKPDEIYHLAGPSNVGLSFTLAEITATEIGLSLLSILEIIKDFLPNVRFFHASSSEVFGNPKENPQNEDTPLNPVNPYGASKAFANNIVSIYRDAFGLFLVNGLLYNHESPRRGETFVSKKVCKTAVEIKKGKSNKLYMGDISISRDWGHAADYVCGMWLSLQKESPEDYIFATGKSHTLEYMLETVFSALGMDWKEYYSYEDRFSRAREPGTLIGNPKKAEKNLGWKRNYSFEKMLYEMVEHEIYVMEKNFRK